MSSVNAPFGLRPSFKEGGIVASTTALGTILSTYGTAIYQYSPVKLVGGYLQAAAAGDAFVGVFMGVEYDNPTTGQHVVSNVWPASLAANNIVAWYTRDPYITYEIQANGSLANTVIGAQYNTAAPSGNAITGLSTTPLDTGSVTTSANAQLRVIGITPGPDNVFGDAFTIVQVQISKHQYVAVTNAIA